MGSAPNPHICSARKCGSCTLERLLAGVRRSRSSCTAFRVHGIRMRTRALTSTHKQVHEHTNGAGFQH